jgi:hypothetical protein
MVEPLSILAGIGIFVGISVGLYFLGSMLMEYISKPRSGAGTERLWVRDEFDRHGNVVNHVYTY